MKYFLFLALFVFNIYSAEHDQNMVYGDFRASYGKIHSTNDESGYQAINNASILGFKGERKKGSLKAFYNLQMGAENNSGNGPLTSRFFLAGVKGNFGSVKVGRLSTPYKLAGLKLDNFYNTGAGHQNAKANFGLSSLTNGWTNASLVYSSPKFANFSIDVATFLDNSEEDNNDYNLGITYENMGLKAGIQYLNGNASGVVMNSSGSPSALRFHAMYKTKMYNVGLSYEIVDIESLNKKAKYAYINGVYSLNAETRVGLSYGKVSDTTSTSTDGVGYTAALFYDLMPKTTVYGLLSRVEYDDDLTSRDSILLAFSHKFSWGM